MEENQMQEEPQRQSMPEDNMGALANVTWLYEKLQF
jgi:hypothetical protein